MAVLCGLWSSPAVAQQSIWHTSNVDDTFRIADSLVELLRHAEAAEVLEPLLAKDYPSETQVALNERLADCYYGNLEEEKVVECFLRILRLEPSYQPTNRPHLLPLFDRTSESYKDEIAKAPPTQSDPAFESWPQQPSPGVLFYVLPGYGQLKTHHNAKGTALLAGGVVAVGASILLMMKYQSSVNDYEASFERYKNLKITDNDYSIEQLAYRNMIDDYDSMLRTKNGRNAAFVFTTAVFALNAIDNLTGGTRAKPSQNSNLEPRGGIRRAIRLTVVPNQVCLTVVW